MPITNVTVGTTAYTVDSRNVAYVDAPAAVVAGGGVRHRGVHILYPLAACRFDRVVNPATVLDAREHITFPNAAVAGGDTIYLHYENNHISSVRLPCPAPAGIDLFVTDNMSGCRFFVDTVAGSNDLVVYHANTRLHSAGPLADCDTQTAAATNLLTQLRTNAAAEYNPDVLANASDCAKPAYCRRAGLGERYLAQQGFVGTNPIAARQAASFVGGTTILGFPAAGSWEFWFQTWGDYDRQMPGRLERRRLRRNIQHPPTQVHAATLTDIDILEHGQFH